MGNALFIVWRESVDAILVISILYAWIGARGDGRIGVRHLWVGVGGGLVLAAVLALAVGREGAETVLFLYGVGLEQSGAALNGMLAGAATGFVLALLTAWLIQRGAHWLPQRVFFRASELVLLLLAAGLLVAGVERLINLEWLPPLLEPVWDSSALLDDGGTLGGIASAFAGYRSQPSLMALCAWGGYWLLVAALGRLQQCRAA